MKPFIEKFIEVLIAGGLTFAVGAVAGFYFLRWKERELRAARELKDQAQLEAARVEAQSIVREAKLAANEQALKIRAETEDLAAARQKELTQTETRLNERETLLNRQLEQCASQEQSLADSQKQCDARQADLDRKLQDADALVQQRRDQLAAVSKLNESETRAAFIRQIEQESQHDAARLSQHILDDARERAEEKARRIISTAIQRCASAHVFETSTATVMIQNDELKGRIIGREGRNIRAFEAATGVTVLIDDTPGAVVLSGFDPVRREIAREAMERLILDGRIHPARIEEVVGKVSQEIEEVVVRAGEEAVDKVGLAPVHFEIVKLLGRLKFRHSFSQNILQHSMEVAHLAGLMAAEMGADVALARRVGLLHDIGKAVNHEVEGAHAAVGAEILKRYGESDAVVNGVASHHGETESIGPIGILIGAADALSASRPGARSETILTYIKRVEDLEKLGMSFPGVEKCFALQAGRELRVMVQPAKVSDDEAFMLARNIARRIENELQYPGQIRVTIVRETRCVEVAK